MSLVVAFLGACMSSDSRLATTPPQSPDGEAGSEDVGSPEYGWTDVPKIDADPPKPNGEVLFAPGQIQEIDIALDDASIEALRALPEESVTAQLSWGGDDFSVALRLKGSASFRTIDEKPSFKIDVHEYDPEQRLDGEKRLTLNNMVQDASMLHEHTYYWLADNLGLPAPRHGYARVYVNGTFYGLYSIVETMDEQLIKQRWPDDRDGNLYEASGADFTYDRDWFGLEEDGGVVATPDDIDSLVDAVEASRTGDFDAVLASRFDREEILTFLALDMVTGNDDGYVFNHHNYLTYHTALSDRWYLLPWGTDRSFTREVPPWGDATTPMLGYLAITCWATPSCAADLETHIDTVEALFEYGLLDNLDATAALIADDCEADTRKEHSCNPEDLRTFIAGRVDFLRGLTH